MNLKERTFGTPCIHGFSQAKKAAAAAKAKARAEFQKRFSNADIRQFTTEVIFNKKNNCNRTSRIESRSRIPVRSRGD